MTISILFLHIGTIANNQVSHIGITETELNFLQLFGLASSVRRQIVWVDLFDSGVISYSAFPFFTFQPLSQARCLNSSQFCYAGDS